MTPTDPWAAIDPEVFAGAEPEMVADLTSTAITPSAWLMDHGPTRRIEGRAYPARHRAGLWRGILRATRGRLHRGRRAIPWRGL